MERTDILNRKQEIIELLNKGVYKQEICKILQCKPNTLNKYLKILGLESSVKKQIHIEQKLEEYLKEDIAIGWTNRFKYKLINAGLKEHKCECCYIKEWLGQKTPIELHHKNGIRSDNRLENLELLCPNCHAMTDNYKSKNIKKEINKKCICLCGNKKGVRSLHCRDCYTKQIKEEKEIKKCKDCENKINQDSIRCLMCQKFEQRKVKKRPTIEVLLSEVVKLGYCAVGRKYGVSDNSIRKWIKYGR